MRRTLGAAAVLVLASATLVACASSGGSKTVSGKTLTVVDFNPFTGPDANFGPEMVAGCEPAVRAINAAGGVLGNKLKCTSVDTRGDPADAVTGATRMLATTSNIFGVLGPSADEANATAPLINQAKVPMFADTGQASFDKTTLKYFWRITPADDVKGYAMAVYAAQRKYLRGAAVFGNDVSSQSNLPSLKSGYAALGGNMVVTEQLALNQTSYRSEVQRVAAAHPDVIFTEASPQADATFLSELKQLTGGLIPIIGTEATLQPQWFTSVSGAVGKQTLTPVYLGEQPYAPPSGQSWTAFNTALLAAGSAVPKPSQWSTDPYTMTYYDAVNIMALAAVSTHSTVPATFNAAIPDVTTARAGATIVHTYADGLAALNAGKKISYLGAGGVVAFDQWHNSTGGFEIASYNADGTLKLVGSVTADQIAPLLGK
jgi:ABC-type branched-subunit amino acid transport system substrate-binding protein